jgi:hypothetical protein
MVVIDEDGETPFAHVPAPEAGTTPLQVGPFTYERLAESAGRANLTVTGRRGLASLFCRWAWSFSVPWRRDCSPGRLTAKNVATDATVKTNRRGCGHWRAFARRSPMTERSFPRR